MKIKVAEWGTQKQQILQEKKKKKRALFVYVIRQIRYGLSQNDHIKVLQL